MHKNSIHYLSHGNIKTGGYRHEMMLGNYLAKSLDTELKVFRYGDKTHGLFSFIKLWNYAFKHSTATLNITVQRLFIPVMLSCLIRRNRMIVVWHHYHEQQQHSLFYHLNAKLVMLLLKSGWSAVRVVVVSAYWRNWFIKNGVSPSLVHDVPNLFNPQVYALKGGVEKQKSICFGQYGVKQHPDIFKLIDDLHAQGYFCYFTTPDAAAAKKEETYAVLNLTYTEYLNHLASSMYTICYSAFPEGWNRLAHESILVGTPVIGNDAGGLGDLLREAGQFMISGPLEAIDIIANKSQMGEVEVFINRYDIKQISYYADSLVVFGKHAIR